MSSPDVVVDGSQAVVEESHSAKHVRIVLEGISGIILLLVAVWVSNPMTTLSLGAVGAFCVADVLRLFPWSRVAAIPHAVVALILTGGAAGLCRTACGHLDAYERILGLPTVAIGIAVHVVAMVILAVGMVRPRPLPLPLSLLIVGLLAGASAFYSALMIILGAFCASCAVAHLVMLVQVILVIRDRGLLQAWPVMPTLAAGALGVSAVYHHRMVPEVRNDPADLSAYLRATWSGSGPVVPITQVRGGDAPSAAIGSLDRARDLQSAFMRTTVPVAPMPASPIPSSIQSAPGSAPVDHGLIERGPRTPQGPSTRAPRTLSTANRWGRVDAPVQATVVLSMDCPVCAQMARTLAELSPEIDQGRVSVRVLVTHRPDSQGGANGARVIYAAGLHDERAFADTLLAMFRSQESVLATTDADVTGLVRAIPSSFPMETAIRILDARQQDVAQLLDDAVRERSRLGVVAEPTLILEDRADSTRRRTFPGYAATDVVRLAITDLSSPRRPSAP